MPLKPRMQVKKFSDMVKRGEMTKQDFHKWLNEPLEPNSLPERVADRPESHDKDDWKGLKT